MKIPVQSVWKINGNYIEPVNSSKTIKVQDFEVEGNLTLSGDLTLGGNVTLGDAPTDVITVNGSLKSTQPILLSNNTLLQGRNLADDANVDIVKVNANDRVEFPSAILLPDGTVNVPAIAFASETNLGIFRSNSDEIAIGAQSHIVHNVIFNKATCYGGNSSNAKIDFGQAHTESTPNFMPDKGSTYGIGSIGHDSLAIISNAIEVVSFEAGKVTTTDATQTTLVNITLDDNKTYHIEAEVYAQDSLYADRAFYHFEGLFYRNGGNATQEGSTQSINSVEGSGAGGWDAVFDTDSNDVRLRVTGELLKTVSWRGVLKYKRVS